MTTAETRRTETMLRRTRGERGSFSAAWRPAPRSHLLERQEEAALVRRARLGDSRALERLIRANLPLVYKIARGYRCRSYSLDDLVQEGVIGLISAIERFDEERGCRLSTYAIHWIRQAVARAVEQNDRLIHIPMQTTADLRRLARIREQHQRDQGRTPTERELAQATGLAEERVEQLTSVVEDAASLEAMVGADQDTALVDLAEDPEAPNPEQTALQEAYRRHLQALLSALLPRERHIVQERYGLDGQHPRTLEELSRRFQISRERVRQIEVRAIEKLRHALVKSQWE